MDQGKRIKIDSGKGMDQEWIKEKERIKEKEWIKENNWIKEWIKEKDRNGLGKG